MALPLHCLEFTKLSNFFGITGTKPERKKEVDCVPLWVGRNKVKGEDNGQLSKSSHKESYPSLFVPFTPQQFSISCCDSPASFPEGT